MEYLINSGDKKELDRFYNVINESFESLVKQGFPEFTLEDFYQLVLTQVDLIRQQKMKVTELEKVFLDSFTSNYIVAYMRFLVSGYLKQHAKEYEPFLLEYSSIDEFCRKEVEPLGQESDELHIQALTNRLGVCVKIEYLDSKNQNSIVFPEKGNPVVFLLYRPGHYDILYPTRMNGVKQL
jgi:ubiquitin thioesterase protein OTUB1